MATMQTACKRTEMESSWVVGWGWGVGQDTGDLGMLESGWMVEAVSEVGQQKQEEVGRRKLSQ